MSEGCGCVNCMSYVENVLLYRYIEYSPITTTSRKSRKVLLGDNEQRHWHHPLQKPPNTGLSTIETSTPPTYPTTQHFTPSRRSSRRLSTRPASTAQPLPPLDHPRASTFPSQPGQPKGPTCNVPAGPQLLLPASLAKTRPPHTFCDDNSFDVAAGMRLHRWGTRTTSGSNAA